MALSTAFIVLLAAALTLRIISEKWRHRQNAQRLGCKPMLAAPTRDPFGIAKLVETVRAVRAKVFPELMERRAQHMADLHGRPVSTYTMSIGFSTTVLTYDAKNIQAILATQFKDFCIGSARETCFGPLMGAGIFTTDGAQWSHSRALLRPQFAREQISNLQMEERHLQNVMRAIPPVATTDGWAQVDMQTIFFRLTLDSATEFLFGESCNSQLVALRNRESSGQVDDFAKYFDRGQWYLAQRLRFAKLAWVYNDGEFKRCCVEVHRFVDRYVERALEKAGGRSSTRTPGDSTAHHQQYVFLDALVAETQDPVELRSQLLNVLLAGRDTTAALLSWMTLMLARHPRVFETLRAEIVERFGSYEDPRDITFETLKGCQYLQWCMKETLRLFPAVPVNARYATRDTSLPRGGGPDGMSPVYLKKGQTVFYNAHILHRRPEFWGNDGLEFRPERWEGRKADWDYIPFNGGPRICPGQQFALTEAGYVMVRLLQRFDGLEDVNADRKIRWEVTTTNAPGDHVTVRWHEAK